MLFAIDWQRFEAHRLYVNGLLRYHWGSRSSEAGCARAPASWLGGAGTLVLSGTDIMNGRNREAAAGAAVRVPCRQ